MSRLDPGLLAPQLPRINPLPTPEERARQDAAIADQQMQIQERQAQADSLRLANQEKRDSYNASMGMRAYMANHADQMKDDPQSFISGLRSVGGKYADPLITSYIQQDKDRLANQEKALGFQESMTKDQIAALSALPDDATDQQKYDALTPVYQKYVQSGILTDQQANKMHTMPVDSQGDLQAHQARLAQARTIHDNEVANNLKIAEAAKAKGEGQKAQAEAQRVGKVPGVDVPFPPEVQAQKIADKSVPQPPMSPGRFAQEKELKGAEDQAVQLTPEGLDIAATNFAKTGQLPPMGMGKQGAGVRSKIINRAAELNPTLDIATNKAEYKANTDSLVGLQKNRDAVTAFENTANKNLDLLLSNAGKIIDTGSPWINQPIRTVSQGAVGDADLSAFNAARQVAVNEIAKVTGNPGLSGQLSDSARKEVEAFIPANATFKQIVSVAKILKQDMANRHQSLDEQIGAIQQRIQGGGSTASTPASDMIDVQIPGQPAGKIHASQWDAFKKKYPNATRK